MPTYDYVCQKCGKTFEIFHSMSDPAKKTCPDCHTETLVKKIGEGSGIIFKGHGFYETDYKHSGACPCEHSGHPSDSCPCKH